MEKGRSQARYYKQLPADRFSGTSSDASGREPVVVLDTVPSYQRADNYRDVGRIPSYSQSAVGRRMSQIQIKKKRVEEKKKEMFTRVLGANYQLLGM